MKTEIKMDNKIEIVRNITELRILHEGKKITFAYPPVSSGIYQNVGREILKRNQRVPYGDYTASLVHVAYCLPEVHDEPEFEDIRDIISNKWLWIYHKNGWTDEGVYVVQDTETQGRGEPLNYKNLEKMLKGAQEFDGVRFSEDGRIRFAPKDTYTLGDHTHESFAKDGFVRASVGIVGAEKLKEVSEKFNHNPRTWGCNIEEGQDPELRVSALGGYEGGRLILNGDYFGGGGSGHAFGVL